MLCPTNVRFSCFPTAIGDKLFLCRQSDTLPAHKRYTPRLQALLRYEANEKVPEAQPSGTFFFLSIFMILMLLRDPHTSHRGCQSLWFHLH